MGCICGKLCGKPSGVEEENAPFIKKRPPPIAGVSSSNSDSFATAIKTIEKGPSIAGGRSSHSEADATAVKTILELKNEISKNPDLRLLVTKYLNIRSNLLMVVLEKLREFKASEEPFTTIEFIEGDFEQQKLMVVELRYRKDKLDKNISSFKWWRKVFTWIYRTLIILVWGCIFVLALAAHILPSVMTVIQTIATGLANMEKWIESLLDDHEKALKWKKDLISKMHDGAFSASHDPLTVHQLNFNPLKITTEKEERKVVMEKIKNSKPGWEEEEKAVSEKIKLAEVEEMKAAMEKIKNDHRERAEMIEDLERNVNNWIKKN